MKRTKRWKTKDGQSIRICDLEDGHLVNILNLLERLKGRLDAFYALTAGPQGEMAMDCFDRECEAVWESDPSIVHPLYDDLADEAEERGLRSRAESQEAADSAGIWIVGRAKGMR
jgi:hypothetical protein